MANYEDVLREARKLPPQAQNELVETLLNEASVTSRKSKKSNLAKTSLEMLSGVSLSELQTLADAILAPGHQRRLRTLLRKSKTNALNEQESKELDALLNESDRLALLKAKARYTLLMSKRSLGA